MCLPMMPAGPDSEVMKPIFTGSVAATGEAPARPVMSTARKTRMGVGTVTSCAVARGKKGGAILAKRPSPVQPAPLSTASCGSFEPAGDVIGNRARPERVARPLGTRHPRAHLEAARAEDAAHRDL